MTIQVGTQYYDNVEAQRLGGSRGSGLR